jgi:hypothetical protein
VTPAWGDTGSMDQTGAQRNDVMGYNRNCRIVRAEKR